MDQPVFFYQLSSQSRLAVLALLAPKALGAGMKVRVQCASAAMVSELDDGLWTMPDDGFLPHTTKVEDPEETKVVLSADNLAPAVPEHCVFYLEGREPPAEVLQQAGRVCIVFDGRDQGELEAARSLWRTYKEKGQAAQYWSQASGGWQKKAETSAKAADA